MKNSNKKLSWKERIDYLLDRFFERGTFQVILLLFAGVFVFVAILAVTITVFCRQEGQTFDAALWDTLASTINAWILYSGDGSWGYLVLTAVGAIVGLLFTSSLISVLASAVEERVIALRNGHAKIIEKDQIIVLGFNIGAYELIRQLCLDVGDRHRCIIVAGSEEKEAIEKGIRENVTIPKRTNIICRSCDCTSPAPHSHMLRCVP